MSCTTSTIEPDFELEFDLPMPVSVAIAQRAGRQLWLAKRHRDELRASGISDEMITASGIRTVSGEEVCRILNWSQDAGTVGTGWALPFDEPDADDCSYQVKLDEPRPRGGDIIKYESPLGSGNRAYFPPGFDSSKGTRIIVTEGGKKSLSAIAHGLNCLGLTGCWNWQKPRRRDDSGRAYGSRQLIDDLAAISWANRSVVIAFDSDAVEKRSVELGQQRLAEMLAKHGAEVKVARLPHGEGGRKLGLDDAIVELGIEAVQEILDAAQEPELPELSWPDLARLFVELRFSYFGEPTIRYWRHVLWRWVDNHYEEVEDDEIKVAAHQFLEDIAWKPNRNAVAEVVAALKAVVAIDSMVEPPSSLEAHDGELPGTPLVFSDQIAFLNFDESLLQAPLPTTSIRPAWFCTGGRSFPYQPHATCPHWNGFLERSLPDPVARRLLRQWCGYLLSGRTHLHKILLLHGAWRGGKSIIADTMSRLIGESAVATSSLSQLSGEFGLSALIGKQLLLVPDAQNRGDCVGAVERVKAISGCDRLDVNRKHKPILTGVRLQTRIVITCNVLPRFLDPSGALHYRLLIVHFPISFAGREDLSLPGKVQEELPGIFNWAYEGWLDLRLSGFVTPPSSADILARAEHTLSPIKAFLDDCCAIGPGQQVLTDDLWAAWQQWCGDSRHQPGNKQKLGSDLSGALPAVVRKQLRFCGQQRYSYLGVSLNGDGSALLHRWHLAPHRRA